MTSSLIRMVLVLKICPVPLLERVESLLGRGIMRTRLRVLEERGRWRLVRMRLARLVLV